MHRLLALTTSLALLASLASTAAAVNPAASGIGRSVESYSDNLPNPLADRQSEARSQALQAVVQGKAKAVGKNKVVRQGKGQFVELAQLGEDKIWTVLGEFGPDENTAHHGGHGGAAGPAHNEIAEPNRKFDNTTIWEEDFSEAYFENILFNDTAGANSMRNWYFEQSSGLYSVAGDVTDWAQVPYNAASYGSDYCGGIVCQDTWRFVDDSVDAWYADMVGAGMSGAEINAYLAPYDVWDRYDWDGDGNFDEPDGYIDHFQSVHAGEGQEAGGGAQGSDAIWSHRWYAYFGGIGSQGPSGDYLLGGLQIGDSGYWIGDYTIEPENGGVGVFSHEFAHDLGLPDLYDTAGNTGGGENSTGFWTVMSSGSWGNDGTVDIGSKPIGFGAWEKLQLGWLDYVVGLDTSRGQVKLGPSMGITKGGYQSLIVLLPDKEVATDLGDAFEGTEYFYSGSGNNLDNTMTRAISAGGALTAKVRYDIEFDWDYAFLESSSDGGTSWDSVLTNRSQTDSDGQNSYNVSRTGITGNSGGGWVDLTAAIPGGADMVRFRYQTDEAVAEAGFMVDLIAIDGTTIGDAESDEGWVFDGFRRTDGQEIGLYFNAYIAESKQYRGYDHGLKTGPYNFGFLNNPDLGNYVEHFQYQEGLLISYWDESFTDNNTGANCDAGRCGGLILPVDAHPTPMIRNDTGGYWRSRVQSFDSPFGLAPTKAMTLHMNSVASFHPSQPGVPVFDDTMSYWNPLIPWSSVQVPGVGVTIRAGATNGSYMWVYLNK
jgi:immune inhibitor A